MPIRKVGTSRVIREVGRGGMSVVYEAYQEALDRKVAVKALDAVAARSEDLAERFRREGRAYAQIHHPAIVAVHDFVEKDEALYLVTEFVDGEDLHELLAPGPLPPDCVAAVGAAVADALECIHAHSLLHRDLKPGNLMISREGAVKVMDFGIVKDPLASALTRTGTVVGTPYYIAPEVLGGDAEDERSDLWSLGVTLYELATGRRPFTGDDYQALFAAVRRGKPERIRSIRREVPRRLANAIERCMERRPDRRWETAALLAAELRAIAGKLLGEVKPEKRLMALLEERTRAAAPAGAPGGTVQLETGDLVPATAAVADAAPSAAVAATPAAPGAAPRTPGNSGPAASAAAKPRDPWRLPLLLALALVLAAAVAWFRRVG
jgi:eukaryotic-like serine/threonine-protein kinase